MRKRLLAIALCAVLIVSAGCARGSDTEGESCDGENPPSSGEVIPHATSAASTDGETSGQPTGTVGASGTPATVGAAAGGSATVEKTTGTTAASLKRFKAVTYPADAVQTLEKRGISLAEFTARAGVIGSYAANRGYVGSGLVVSPYYSLQVNGENVPVYAAQVYIGGTDNKGALHSFAVLETVGSVSLTVKATKKSGTVSDLIVLPSITGVKPSASGNTVTMTLTAAGAYTLLTDGADQETALTVFVRRARDEEQEIAAYKAKYGEARVRVFEPGVHELEYINVPCSNYVIYLRSGALLLAKHVYNIQSDAENNSAADEDTAGQIGTAQLRFPFLNCHNRSDVHIVGSGIIDLTPLDWHERRGIFITQSTDVSVEGVTVINPPEWTLMAYRCEDVTVQDVTVFGYRTNSDGIAICNTKNARVSHCFARSGDDMFEVKTLGGPATAVAQEITFTDCVAWGGKARCFGIIGEVNLPVSDVIFRRCAILYRDAVWDNDRLGGLVVVLEEKGAAVSNVTFEDIEIFRDKGRAINCCYYNSALSGCTVTGLTFRNINCRSDMPLQFKSLGKNTIKATLENVKMNGRAVTAANASSHVLQDSGVSLTVS